MVHLKHIGLAGLDVRGGEMRRSKEESCREIEREKGRDCPIQPARQVDHILSDFDVPAMLTIDNMQTTRTYKYLSHECEQCFNGWLQRYYTI